MNKMNKRQIAQIAISVAGFVLIIAWLCMPGWEARKILGIIPAILIILSMVFSFIAEEKRKRQ